MAESLILYMGSLLLRSIGIAAIAALFSWRIRNVAMRHAIWAAVLGAMLLMPALDHLLPASWVPSRIQPIAVEQAVTPPLVVHKSASIPGPQPPLPSPASSQPLGPRQVNWWLVAVAIYASVSFAMLVILAAAYRKVWNLRRKGTPIYSYLWEELVSTSRITRRVPALLESDTVRVPVTIGFLKPVVVLPSGWQSWDELKLMAVLSHEFAHVRRGDWAIAVLAATAKCAYWINPLSWFLERKLSVLAEQASDDAVILSTRDTTRYAEILLEFAATAGNSGRYFQGGVWMAQHNTRARIERVLSNKQSGTGVLKVAGWLLVVILATPVLYSAAAIQVSPERSAIPATSVGTPTAIPQPRLLPVNVPSTASTLPSAPAQPTPQNLSRPAPQPVQLPQLPARQQARPNEIVLRLAASQSSGGGPYVIKPGDVLNIHVWKQPELTGKVTVQPDGQISIPLVQDISAAGSTPGQLKAEIERRLKDKLSTIDVTVMIESMSSYRVYLTGLVNRPGVVTSETALTVLEALALAGGFQNFAKRDGITIIRNSESATFGFSYSNVIAGTHLAENITLKNGDVVVVP